MKYIVKLLSEEGDELYIGEVEEYADVVDFESQAKRFDKIGDARITLKHALEAKAAKSGEVVGVD